MLKIDKTWKTTLATASCFLITFLGYGAVQDSLEDGPDPPPAPIDDFIVPMIIIAIMIGVIYLTKVVKSKQQNC